MHTCQDVKQTMPSRHEIKELKCFIVLPSRHEIKELKCFIVLSCNDILFRCLNSSLFFLHFLIKSSSDNSIKRSMNAPCVDRQSLRSEVQSPTLPMCPDLQVPATNN